MLPLAPAFLSACHIFCFAFFFFHYGQRGVSKSLWQENLSPALKHNRKSIFTQQQECHATFHVTSLNIFLWNASSRPVIWGHNSFSEEAELATVRWRGRSRHKQWAQGCVFNSKMLQVSHFWATSRGMILELEQKQELHIKQEQVSPCTHVNLGSTTW